MASKIGAFENSLNATLWDQLKNGVPEGVLQLRYEMMQIETDSCAHKTQSLFDQLMKYLHDNGFKVLTMANLGYDTKSNTIFIQ